MNSMLQARDPQGCIFPERTPTVKQMHCRMLKSQKDLFLFLPQTEKFSSSSSSNMSPVQAKTESPEMTINRRTSPKLYKTEKDFSENFFKIYLCSFYNVSLL